MKKILLALFITVFTLVFTNCEKDDICEEGTPTTPQMVIEFYDNSNPSQKKNVTNLGIVADGFTEGMLFNGVSKIMIPLKTNDQFLKYKFVFDATNTNVSLQNEDVVDINYSKKDLYISRACGFKSVFELNSTNGLFLYSDANNWIKEINIQNYSITTENDVHVKIFF